MAKKGDHDWNSMSMEGAIIEGLSFLGADDRTKNAVTTKGVAAALVNLGYPADILNLGIKICEVAVKHELNGVEIKPDGGRRKFIGATWIGQRAKDEYWNRHQWALPLWKELEMANLGQVNKDSRKLQPLSEIYPEVYG